MNLRAPAVPLITVDPFFSVWSPDTKLNHAKTEHWSAKGNSILGTVTVDGVSAMILVQGDVAEAPAVDNNVSNNTENKGSSNGTNWTLVIIVWAVVAVICAGAVLLLLKKK